MSSTPDDEIDLKRAKLTFAHDNNAEHASTTINHPHHYSAKARERIRHFLHPDGRRIHVATSPEESLRLRKQLEQLHKQDEFDVFLSGTAEHLEALRTAHEHHEERRQDLERQHSEVYSRFATIHAELDALSSELNRVTTQGVSLEAHFSKYGYDAHIRSYDDASPDSSGATTPRSSLHEHRESRTSEAETGFATPLKLFKMPVVRQYFHKGILWRGSGSEEVQSFELFVDLLYVGIIAINGDAASEDATGLSLLRFVITFTLTWKIWNDMASIISWFETRCESCLYFHEVGGSIDRYKQDIFQRLSIIFLLICLFGFTTNIMESFENTYPTLIGFYLAARLYMTSYLGLIAALIPMIRGMMIFHICINLLGVALWIGSVHTEWPNQLALIWLALFIDLVGQIFYMLFMALGKKVKSIDDWVNRTFEFYPGTCLL
nr:uncharacterized protein LOC112020285 [Quercus suber]POF15565.1 hypothetical protein CFP56_48759 [Quercus suber]